MYKFPTYLSILVLICLATTGFGQVSRIRSIFEKTRRYPNRALMRGPGQSQSPGAPSFQLYPLYLNSTQFGSPDIVTHESSVGPPDSLHYDYQGIIRYQGGRPSEILFVDSVTLDTFAREQYTFSPTGKILSYRTYYNSSTGWEAGRFELYTYDQHDSIATFDDYYYDQGVPTRVQGTHYKRTYDASGRITSQIDSIYWAGRFIPESKTEYTYQGTSTAPRQITYYDTAAGSFEPSIRLARIVWNNYSHFWVSSADIQVPVTGSIFVTLGSMAGVLTGQEFATTASYRTSLTGPLQPKVRATTGFNDVGDQIRSMEELYDSASASWTVNTDERYVHTYANPGGRISRMVNYSYDPALGVIFKRAAYGFINLPTTSVKARPSLTRIHPNPATNQSVVSGRAGAAGQILATTGQVVRSFRIGDSGKVEVRLEGLAPGIYQVRAEGGAPSRLVVE